MKEIFDAFDGAIPTNCADLHTHTVFSDGKATPFELVELAEMQGVDSLAITDHNSMYGSVVAAQYAVERGSAVDVVQGSEIATESGHVLIVYQKEDIPPKKSLEWTILAAHEQEALIIAAHPFLFQSGIGEAACLSIMENIDPRIYFDGFEIENKGVDDIERIRQANAKASAFYTQYKNVYPHKLGAALGNSDNHFFGVGRSRTWYNGELREAIKSRQTLVARNTIFEDKTMIGIAYTTLGPKVLERVHRLQALNQKQ